MARKIKKLAERNIFYIYTNGKQTERNYLNLLKSLKSIYDVKIIYLNSDPLQLVEYAKTQLGLANQVWCVFDVDDFHKEGKIYPAMTLAKNAGVKIAISNKCFEIWLLLHFKLLNSPLTIQQLNRQLDNSLSEISPTLKYEKNDSNTLKKYFIPKITTAIENAKICYQTHIKNHNEKHFNNPNYPIWDWNPCTTVFLLIENLQLKKL